MKKLNKIVAVVLAAAMSVSLLACGGDKPAANNGGNASGDKVTINVHRRCFNLETPDEAQIKKVEDAINEYIADKINVQIKLNDIASEYEDKVNLALANKEIDLLWTASWESVIGTKDLYAANAVYDITDLLPGSKVYESMDAKQWEASKYGGKNYFIPVYKDNVEGYDFMFRQELVDKYGWDVSKVSKLQDLEPMLADAKSEGLKYPFLTQRTAMFYRWYIDSFDFFTGDATSNFVAVDRKTNEVVDTILTPEYKEFCTLMCKWAEEGYISEDEVTKTTTDATTQTQDWAISWWTDVPNNDEADSRYKQDVTLQTATKRYLHTDSMLGSCYCIAATTTPEKAQAALDFLGLLYTDSKLADLYCYGIEGEDYTRDANGLVIPGSEKYNHSMWESASATVVTAPAESPYTAQMYIDFNNGADISCANGFHFDKAPVDAQYTACQKVFEQYGFGLENGGYASADVEATIQAYQAALDEAGYQDVLAEFTKQYNEWK